MSDVEIAAFLIGAVIGNILGYLFTRAFPAPRVIK